MSRNYAKLVLLLFFIPIAVAPQLLYAINCPDGFTPKNGICEIKNPFGTTGIAGATQPQGLLLNIISMALFFTGSLAVLFLIIGGFQLMTSGASEDNLKKGKQTIKYAIVGILVVLSSYVIVIVVRNLVDIR